MKSKSAGKTQMTLNGGPFNKARFPLTYGNTLEFTVGKAPGYKGHYDINGKWVSTLAIPETKPVYPPIFFLGS